MTASLLSSLRAPTPLGLDTRLGTTRLVVRDLAGTSAFWRDHIGLRIVRADDELVHLHAGADPTPLVTLQGDPAAPRAARNAAGLYHVALLLPTRMDLARALHHLVASGTPLQGASDHGVSEALYLADPEGNGIEIYRDRPRGEWGWDSNGVRMTLAPLDARSLMAELDAVPADQLRDGTLPAGTTVGHMHLQVRDVPEADAWYRDALGMDIVARIADTAAFVSAGGYHHHVGMNSWHSRGGPTPTPGSTGLGWSTLVLADAQQREDLLTRAGGGPFELDGAPALRDPSGNAWRLEVADA